MCFTIYAIELCKLTEKKIKNENEGKLVRTSLQAPCLQKGHGKELQSSFLAGFFEGSQYVSATTALLDTHAMIRSRCPWPHDLEH